MRIVASALIAAALLPVLTAGASRADLGDTMAIRTITAAGQKSMLSVHDWPTSYTLSPDLKRYAYVPLAQGGGRSTKIRVSRVNAVREHVLVDSSSEIFDVAWAPSGSLIAFSAVDGVWLMRPDGTGLRRMADFGDTFGLSLAWSPDSRELAIEHPADTPQRAMISVLTLDTGAIRDVASGIDASWSPDGRSLLYTVPKAGSLPEIQIAPVDGGEPRTIAHGSEGLWAPGGKRVAFQRPLGREPSSLWVVSARGGKAKLLAHWATEAIWSPKGRKIVFLKVRETRHLCQERYRSTVGLVPSSGGKVRVLTRIREAVELLAWSHDARRVLYLSGCATP